MKLRLELAALAFGMLLAAAPSRAELLVNPGFESGGAPWGSFGNAGFHNFFGANGHASLFMDNPGNFGGVFQTGIAGNSSLTYTFALTDVRIEANAAANARFGLEYYAANDSTKLGETIVSIPLPGVEVNGGMYSMMGTPVAGTSFVRPIILFDNVTSTANGQENLFVFSASLTAVPEPTVLPMALTAFAGAASIRRRK